MRAASPIGVRRRGVFDTSLRIVAKAQLHADLVVADLAFNDVALNLGHLEPVEVPERFRRSLDAVLDGVLDTFFRRSDDLRDTVDMIAHFRSLVEALDKFQGRDSICGSHPKGDVDAAFDTTLT